jgi:pimeloyl-ACP methyl ester carboxylesterase
VPVHAHDPAALPPGTVDPGRIESFAARDGRLLRYRVVDSPHTRFHLLYLHGLESHGAWFLPAAARLLKFGCTTYLLDRRGSGLNRDPEPGDAPSARVLLEDVRQFRNQLGAVPIYLAGLSWGGKFAVAVAIDQPQDIRGMILVTPGLRYRTDLSLLEKTLVCLSLLAGGHARFRIPIEPEMFTRTPRVLEFIRHDPWRLHEATARFLVASRILDLRIGRRIEELRLPILLLLAGHDPIIDNRKVLNLLARNDVQAQTFDDAIHAIQFDQMEPMVQRIGSFLQQVEGRC